MVGLGLAFVVGSIVRLALLPTRGFADDIDQFVGWVNHIANSGLGDLYGVTAAGPVTFGPVMGYVWALLAWIDPAFKSATDASDPSISILMKLPAAAADIGIAAIVAYALRSRPRLAIAGAAAILFHPAVLEISSWWGQYESVYLVSALAATVLAINGRNTAAAAAIVISVMTKPQALPLLLPFAAWFFATGGWRDLVRAAIAGSAVLVVVWLPFLAAGGPADYLRNLGTYQNDIFNVLSLRAWNLWWLVQEAAAHGEFLRDDTAVVGPITLRIVGYGIAVLLDVAIAAAIVRWPSPRVLVLGLIASVLVFFSFATQMHERYAYGAVVWFALLVGLRPARWLGLAFGVVFTINVFAAIPPSPLIGDILPISGILGVTGSIAILAITAVVLRMLVATPRALGGTPGPPTT